MKKRGSYKIKTKNLIKLKSYLKRIKIKTNERGTRHGASNNR